MKRTAAAILAIFYLGTSLGATIHLHYCMDKLVAWSLSSEKTHEKACPYCGMPKIDPNKHCGRQRKGCCQDEVKHITVEKDQKAVDANFEQIKPAVHLADYPIASLSFVSFVAPASQHPNTHAPPGEGKTPIFILNHVFRV